MYSHLEHALSSLLCGSADTVPEEVVGPTHIYLHLLAVRVLDGGIIALNPHILNKLSCHS